MTKYVFIDDDGDKWELQNGRWVLPAYTSLRPKSTAELYHEYGGAPYIEVENWDSIPTLPDEPAEIGAVYQLEGRGKYVRYTDDACQLKPWIGTKSRAFYSWESIHE